MTPFDITCEDLGRLDAFAAVRVFHDLLFAEAACVAGIDASKIDVPMSTPAITTPDGGIDAEVADARPGRGSHGIIKRGRTAYQIKSGNVDIRSLSDAKAMVSVRGSVGPRVHSCLLGEGTYVVVLFGSDKPDTEDNKSARLVRQAIDELDPSLKGKGSIEVWRQNKLCGFLRSFPSICLAVRRMPPTALHTMGTWQALGDMLKTAAFDLDQRNMIDEIRRSALNSSTPIRVTGDPGVGKTRLVMEALKSEETAPLVIYAARPSDLPGSFLRALTLPNSPYRCILVVDECPKALFRDIWNQLGSASDRVKLITICNEIESSDPSYNRLQVTPLDSQEVAKIITSYGVPEHKVSSMAQLCGGSPRVAHIVGAQMQAFRSVDIASHEDVWQRYIAGCDEVGSEAYHRRLRVLEWLSLFVRFGYEKPYANEGNQVVCKIAHATDLRAPIVAETISELRSKKILQGDRTLYITPKLLHLWLWSSWWDKQGPSFSWNDFVTIDGADERLCDELIAWFVDMLQYARESTVVPRVIGGLLGDDGPFVDEKFIETFRGSRLLTLIADIDPEKALEYVEHYLDGRNPDELREFRRGRRCFIDVLKRAAFEPHLFDRSARQLFLLACSENEVWVNNATGAFAELFSNGCGELAPSKASPAQRFPVLQAAASSDLAGAPKVAIKAIGAALRPTTHKVIGVSEADLLRESEPGWMPKTYNELWEGFRSAWNLGMDCLETYNGESRRQLADTLRSCAFGLLATMGDGSEPARWLRDLYATGCADESKLINDIARKLRYSERLSDAARTELEDLRTEMAGTNYEARIRRYVGLRVWAEEHEGPEIEPSNTDEIMAALARETLERREGCRELLPWLVSKQPENAYRFGVALGGEDASATLWPQIMTALRGISAEERGSQFLSGYLRQLHCFAPDRWGAAIQELRDDESLIELLPPALSDEGISDELLVMLTSLFSEGGLTAECLRPLGFCNGLDSVSDASVCHLLDALAHSHSACAASLAVEISYSQLKSGRSLPSAILASVINQPELLGGALPYLWCEVACAYLDTYPNEAAAITSTVIERLDDHRIGEPEGLPKVLRRLAQHVPGATWSAIGERLLIKGRYYSLAFDSSEAAHAIAAIPSETVLSWIGVDGDTRASLALSCFPLALYDEEGQPTTTREIVAEYGQLESVVQVLMAKVYSFSCSGSVARHYGREVERLEGYRKYEENPQVLNCLEELISACKSAQEKEAIREERLGW